LTLRLTKTAKQKFLYKINVDLSHSQSDVLSLIKKMRELYSHDINAVEMNVTRNGSQILIDSNQNIPSMLEQEGIEIDENIEQYKPKQPSVIF